MRAHSIKKRNIASGKKHCALNGCKGKIVCRVRHKSKEGYYDYCIKHFKAINRPKNSLGIKSVAYLY